MQTSCPVSVIIPTYNRARHLDKALSSVAKQTKLPQQVIVIDDGSTDDTAILLKQKYPGVHYIYQQNSGVSAARNAGIRHLIDQHISDSHWVALLDSDDEWLPNKLERQLEFWSNKPQHRLIHCDEIWIRNGRRVNPMKKHQKHGGQIFHHCLPLCAISPSAVLIQLGLLKETGLFDEDLPACEDYDLWLRICHREPVLFLNEQLVIKQGGHDDQLSKKYWGMDRFRVIALINCLEKEKLSTDKRQATSATLSQKLDILLQGAIKRGQLNDVKKYTQLKNRYCTTITT